MELFVFAGHGLPLWQHGCYIVLMNHADWVEEISGGEAINAIATKAGLVHRTFARQVERGHVTAENVIAIAIAYGHHPVGALVDTEYLDEKWAQQIDPARALREVTEDQLADEVLRRMKIGVEPGGSLDLPLDEVAKRRARRTDGGTRSGVEDYGMPELAVADSSPFHEEENTEFDD